MFKYESNNLQKNTTIKITGSWSLNSDSILTLSPKVIDNGEIKVMCPTEGVLCDTSKFKWLIDSLVEINYVTNSLSTTHYLKGRRP